MRTSSLLIALLLILFLSLFLLLQTPTSISSLSELEELPENSLVSLSSSVTKETLSPTRKTLTLNNSIKAICDRSCPPYLNSQINIIGHKETFPPNTPAKIKILKITN